MKLSILVAASLIAFNAAAASNATVDTTSTSTAENQGVENGIHQQSDSKSLNWVFPQAVMPGMVSGAKCTNNGVEVTAIVWNFISWSRPVHEIDVDCQVGDHIKQLLVTCQFRTAAKLQVKHLNQKYPGLDAEYDPGTKNYPMQQCFAQPAAPASAPPVEKSSEKLVPVEVIKIVSRASLDLGTLFYVDRDDLIPAAKNIMREKLMAMGDIKNIKVTSIDGHTDSDGSAAHNKSLSERRAQSVAKLLREIGITVTDDVVHGHGESSPLVPNNGATGKAINRRVTLQVETISK